MNVVAFNGSPRKNGNTAAALKIVMAELNKQGIETEPIHVGKERVRGCIACYGCAQKSNGRCVTDDDPVNEWIQKMKEADGILLGSPVYFSGVAGTMKSFLDRAYLVALVNNGLFRHKVGAPVVAVRRSGGLTTMNSLNHYILISEMILPASNYWTVAHGANPGEMERDEEGKQIMEVLGKNMGWLLRIIEKGKKEVPPPAHVMKTQTNFIR